MTRCAKCNRPLLRPSESGYGPVCARSLFGAKPRRVKRENRKGADERTPDMFAEVTT
jgi:hypothetical protein